MSYPQNQYSYEKRQKIMVDNIVAMIAQNGTRVTNYREINYKHFINVLPDVLKYYKCNVSEAMNEILKRFDNSSTICLLGFLGFCDIQKCDTCQKIKKILPESLWITWENSNLTQTNDLISLNSAYYPNESHSNNRQCFDRRLLEPTIELRQNTVNKSKPITNSFSSIEKQTVPTITNTAENNIINPFMQMAKNIPNPFISTENKTYNMNPFILVENKTPSINPFKPVETKPVETKPVETKPVETKPVETKPVETKPMETKPVETKPIETKPMESNAVESNAVETNAMENKDALEKENGLLETKIDKSKIPCFFKNKCNNEKCVFLHPKQIPCKYENIHGKCIKKDCLYSHSNTEIKDPTSLQKNISPEKEQIPCYHLKHCIKRNTCKYLHPDEINCKYEEKFGSCKNADLCVYKHKNQIISVQTQEPLVMSKDDNLPMSKSITNNENSSIQLKYHHGMECKNKEQEYRLDRVEDDDNLNESKQKNQPSEKYSKKLSVAKDISIEKDSTIVRKNIPNVKTQSSIARKHQSRVKKDIPNVKKQSTIAGEDQSFAKKDSGVKKQSTVTRKDQLKK